MLLYREGQELLKAATETVRGTHWWDILFPTPDETTWFEDYSDNFMITYAKSVITEMGLEKPKEYLELSDWLAAQKDLNEAIK